MVMRSVCQSVLRNKQENQVLSPSLLRLEDNVLKIVSLDF